MRCPDCNKFVPYDTEVEPEEANEPNITDTHFAASYTRTLTCEECGTELKSLELEAEVEITGAAKAKKPEWCKSKDNGHEHEWDFDLSVEPTTGSINKDRHGRPIRNHRYIATTYGVSVSGSAKCEHCNAACVIEASAEERASSFDEMV